MREIIIAMADLSQGDTYLMQHRTHDPNKPAAGLIGFFGGQLELHESSAQAVSREVSEETSLVARPEDFTSIGSFSVRMRHNGEELDISGEFFHYEVPPGLAVSAKEGELVRIPKLRAAGMTHEMSPATLQVFKQYIQGRS